MTATSPTMITPPLDSFMSPITSSIPSRVKLFTALTHLDRLEISSSPSFRHYLLNLCTQFMVINRKGLKM
ncbi:hypothetical protein QE152_g11429 [Popillia japonica]|uniref:Uncharacterized protein n=1 Tax=Popillia japonica TaxID=7064 RepID=A0AAW1LPL3_POPJA